MWGLRLDGVEEAVVGVEGREWGGVCCDDFQCDAGRFPHGEEARAEIHMGGSGKQVPRLFFCLTKKNYLTRGFLHGRKVPPPPPVSRPRKGNIEEWQGFWKNDERVAFDPGNGIDKNRQDMG